MVMHPWMRSTPLAGTLGLIMGGIGIVITSLSMEGNVLKTIFLTLGVISLIPLTILFWFLVYLAIRDYADLYKGFTRKLFGIPFLRY